MPTAKIYRAKASDLLAQARDELVSSIRIELENLALHYLKLADEAEASSKTENVYEAPPAEQPEVQQQQEQPQLQRARKSSRLTPHECRDKAEECRKMALVNKREPDRIMLLHMAETWTRIEKTLTANGHDN
jgi:cytosine/adenosine deaminase-related metal-dependent hydrolase